MSNVKNFISDNRAALVFQDYDYDEPEVGELIRDFEELEKHQPKKPAKAKKTSRSKLKTIVVADYDDVNNDEISEMMEYYFKGKKKSSAHLEMIENTIPSELRNIGAGKYRNETLEQCYKKQFCNDDLKEEDCDTSIKLDSPKPTKDATVTPEKDVPKKNVPKKNRKSLNAFLKGLEERKPKAIDETSEAKSKSDVSPNVESNISSSVSSEDFHSVNEDSSYLTATSDLSTDSLKEKGTFTRKKHSTSKRLPSSVMVAETPKKNAVQPKKVTKKKQPAYIPASYNHDFEYDQNDFPPISPKS